MFTVIYGLIAYVCFVGSFTYAVAFIGNAPVPKTIDGGPPGPIAEALLVNLVLLGIFAVQHSVMARRGFKRWWTKFVPEAVERSTFVLAASAALGLLLWKWQPIPEPVLWRVVDPAAAQAITAVFWFGWLIVLLSTFLINHFELFGLRQVYSSLADKPLPEPEFRTPLFYRYVRHPLYAGMLLSLWAVPVMTRGHLLFAAVTTAYIFVGIALEERDLLGVFGDEYRSYRKRVPMVLPWPR